MLENWSLVLNVLLLIGVLVTIGFVLKARKKSVNPERFQPSLGLNAAFETKSFSDDIISVRQIIREDSSLEEEAADFKITKKTPLKSFSHQAKPEEAAKPATRVVQKEATETKACSSAPVMMFLLAKENRQFAGYEFLQTVLAAGLRFGEGQLFHRHQFSSGKGPVLCSLAAATAAGVFDLQNIGAFSVKGLCLFMHASQNPNIDAERFSIMLETARQLSEGLDAQLLDDQRLPLTDERLARYYNLLNIDQTEFAFETV